MQKAATFAARARVVDLLGREQIADAPTAVSELLKNAIDALATSSEVRFDHATESLQIEDNGLGMRTKDVLEKWLVLATDSKRGSQDVSWLEAANDDQRTKSKAYRPLGEKGIGRLAVAALGRGVLVWTRWGNSLQSERTLLFIHWHLFQHSRLSLADIIVPYAVIADQATDTEAKGLLTQMRDWLLNHEEYWVSEFEQRLRDDILRDLDEVFPECISAIPEFLTTAGTLFCVMGVTPEAEEVFSEEHHDGEDVNVSEGLRLLLGFCDPFHEESPRLDVRISIDGETSIGERDFWRPDDFPKADHEITLQVDSNGYVTGKVRRYHELYNYSFQLTGLPERSYFPGPFTLKLGYIAGKSESLLNREEHGRYSARLNAYGALYVYRDGIRVLPYGRIDVDFLGLEERRSLKAGRYFFSHRRMFGAIYLTHGDNPELRDKAGREGLIKNGAYRGFVTILRAVFLDLADTYFGLKSKGDEQSNSESERRDTPAARRAKERIARTYDTFVTNLSHWRERLPELEKQISAKLRYVAVALDKEESLSLPGPQGLRPLSTTIDSLRLDLSAAYRELRTDVPEVILLSRDHRDLFDRYLADRGLFEQRSSRDFATLVRRFERLVLSYEPYTTRLERIEALIDETRLEYTTKIESASQTFRSETTNLTSVVVPNWKDYQLNDLANILKSSIGENPIRQVADDPSGERMQALELALLSQRRRLNEVHLPFWSLMCSQISNIDNAENGEIAIGELNRSLEIISERERNFATLAQLGLVVESMDHEYNVLFSDIKSDLQSLNEAMSSGFYDLPLLRHLNTGFESLEMKLRLLTPLYRRRFGRPENITGQAIRDFIEQLYSESRREGVDISYTQRFLGQTITQVNKPVVLAAAANLVNNSLYWTKRTSAPARISFTVIPNGFVVSDSGPGIAEVDRERIFEPFLSRRPHGRGLGLYITRTNLEANGLEIFSTEPQKGALPGANFVIRKREVE